MQMQMLSHFSSKAPWLSLPLPRLSLAALSLRCPSYASKFRFRPSLPLKFSGLPLACHLSSRMDSPSPDVAVSVDSVARDLQNQSLRNHDDHEGDDLSNGSNRVRLKLEDLNWDQSFVRQLPGDPRSDAIPREVSFLPFDHFDIFFP